MMGERERESRREDRREAHRGERGDRDDDDDGGERVGEMKELELQSKRKPRSQIQAQNSQT